MRAHAARAARRSRCAPAEVPEPEPGAGQLLLRVRACGVCRTDLHLRDGELEPGHLPLILGHQIVGVDRGRPRASACRGSAWTCGDVRVLHERAARTCARRARFTGRDVDGGYAEYAVADERFCFPLPDGCPTSRWRRCCAAG